MACCVRRAEAAPRITSWRMSAMNVTGRFRLWLTAAVVLVAAGPAWAAEPIDSGDTAWMLTSSVLVVMMTIPVEDAAANYLAPPFH